MPCSAEEASETLSALRNACRREGWSRASLYLTESTKTSTVCVAIICSGFKLQTHLTILHLSASAWSLPDRPPQGSEAFGGGCSAAA